MSVTSIKIAWTPPGSGAAREIDFKTFGPKGLRRWRKTPGTAARVRKSYRGLPNVYLGDDWQEVAFDTYVNRETEPLAYLMLESLGQDINNGVSFSFTVQETPAVFPSLRQLNLAGVPSSVDLTTVALVSALVPNFMAGEMLRIRDLRESSRSQLVKVASTNGNDQISLEPTWPIVQEFVDQSWVHNENHLPWCVRKGRQLGFRMTPQGPGSPLYNVSLEFQTHTIEEDFGL